MSAINTEDVALEDHSLEIDLDRSRRSTIFVDDYGYRTNLIARMQLMFQMVNKLMLLMITLLVVMQIVRLVPSFQRILEAKADIAQAQVEGLHLLPDLEARIADLDKRTKALTTREIGSRLALIEQVIGAGEVNPSQLQDFQSLREEFGTLKSFMFASPEQMVEFRAIQRDYLDLKDAVGTIMPKADIAREIDSTKSILYWNLGVFGVLASVFAGAWFVALRQSMKIQSASVAEAEAGKKAKASHASPSEVSKPKSTQQQEVINPDS